MIVFLRDGILSGEPQILLGGQGVVKAGPGKALDRIVLVIHAHQHAGSLEFEHGFMEQFLARSVGKGDLRFSGARNPELAATVNVPIRMTRNGNGLGPAAHRGL